MYSYESSQNPISDFSFLFPRSSLPAKVIYLRKISQEKHVKRMKVALEKKEMKPPGDMYSVTSNPRRTTSYFKSPFTSKTRIEEAEDTGSKIPKKIMHYPTKLNWSYTISPKRTLSCSRKCNNKCATKLSPTESKADRLFHTAKDKMEATHKSTPTEKSPLKHLSNKKNATNEKSKSPGSKENHLSKNKATSSRNQKHQSTSDLTKNEVKCDKIASVSENALDYFAPKASSYNISKPINTSVTVTNKNLKDIMNLSPSSNPKSEDKFKKNYASKEPKTPTKPDNKITKASKIPLSLTRLSTATGRRRDSNSFSKQKAEVTNTDSVFTGNENQRSTIKEVLTSKNHKKYNQKMFEKQDKKETISQECPILDVNLPPHSIDNLHDSSNSKRVGISLEIAPRKISSISLWLESLDPNETDNKTNPVPSKSQKNKEKVSIPFGRNLRSNLKSGNTNDHHTPTKDFSASEKPNKDLQSDHSSENYYGFDDTDEDTTYNYKSDHVDDAYEWTEGTDYDDLSSGSKPELNSKNTEDSTSPTHISPVSEKHHCTPYNLRSSKYKPENMPESCTLDSKKLNYIDTKEYSAKPRNISSATPKKKKGTKLKKSKKLKKQVSKKKDVFK